MRPECISWRRPYRAGWDGGDRDQGGGPAARLGLRAGGGAPDRRGPLRVGRRPGPSAWSATGSSTGQTSGRPRWPARSSPPMTRSPAPPPVGPPPPPSSGRSPSTCAAARPRSRRRRRGDRRDLDTSPDRVWLEPWAPSSASCVWRFNALFWQALVDWEKATGREYEQTLPGGESDARNSGAARETILDLFKIWDELASRRALPSSSTCSSSASATAARRGPGSTSSWSSTAGTAATTTGGCTT